MATSSKQNSRFSSLKVFKFAAGSKPPPLPPKDPYYLSNPSLRSLGNTLSPDSGLSQPPTPFSATLLRTPSPTPSYTPSSVSYTPSSVTISTSTNSPAESASATSRKGLFKFSSFSRRPKTPKTADSTLSIARSDSLRPPEPEDDPSISMPWNFQHNIHVDECLVGLPPTWSASLLEAGFSEEEIAAIQAKRAESRSRSTRSIYSLNVGRAASPAVSARAPFGNHPPAGNLRRDQSDASLSQVSLVSSHQSYGSRSHNRKVSASSCDHSEYSYSDTPPVEHDVRHTSPIARPIPQHSFTYPQLHSQSTPHLPSHRDMSVPLPPTAISVVSDNSSSSGASEKQLMAARNAPTRAYHVANESVGTISHSPPPAYMSPKKENKLLLSQADDRFRLPPSISAELSSQRNDLGRPSVDSAYSGSEVRGSSMLLAAPRLSLHQDDLSSWTKDLFSSFPTSVTLTPPKPVNHAASPPRLGSVAESNTSGSPSLHDRSPSTRQLPPKKPLPRQEPPPVGALPPPPSMANDSSLWYEVMSMIKPATSMSVAQDLSADMSTDSQYSSILLTPVLDEFPPIPRITDPNQLDLHRSLAREKENRDSGLSTMTVTPATIATAAVARSVRPNMVVSPLRPTTEESRSRPARAPQECEDGRSHSPNSAESHSSLYSTSTSASSSTGTGSASSDSRPQTLTTPESQDWLLSGTKVKAISPEPSPEPSPRASSFSERESYSVSITDLSGQRQPSIIEDHLLSPSARSGGFGTPVAPTTPSPNSPAPRYPGWLSDIVAPLKGFLNDQNDPRDLFADLREIAEGESGSVFAARVLAMSSSSAKEPGSYVAIKNIPIMPSGCPKIDDLQRELVLMKGVSNPHILTMDSLFVDLVEDSLWIQMELMERSIADVIPLLEEDITLNLNEKLMAQIAGDVLQALSYLQTKGIAHRDVRSDNLLVNREGVVKLADFSSAVKVTRLMPTRSDPAGVIYWQAPEVRQGSYNALKVDVWSIGATVWELAEAKPPFSDVTDPRQVGTELPPLTEPDIYSRSFHDFLHLCSNPSNSRPDPHDLLSASFICNPSGRQAIVDLLADCQAVEQRLSRRQSTDSTGTVSRP